MKTRRRFAVVGLGLILAVALPGASFAAEPEVAPPSAWDVYQVLHVACTECHGGHLSKPKAKLGYILDLPRLIEEKYIQPGDPERSDIFTALISTDEDEQMPPADSDGHKPTAAEIETIRSWIAAGAITGETPTDGIANASESPAAAAAAKARPLLQTFGRLHPMMVHFPIALLLCACCTELTARFRPGQARWLQGTTRGSLWVAAIGGILAATFGWLNAAYEGYASGETDVHRWLGVSTATLAVIALVVSEAAERARIRDPRHGSRTVLLGLLVVSAIVVTLAGHTGGVLAYGQDYLGW